MGQVTRDLLKTIPPEPWPQIEAKREREQILERRELKHRTGDAAGSLVSVPACSLCAAQDGSSKVLETKPRHHRAQAGRRSVAQRVENG